MSPEQNGRLPELGWPRIVGGVVVALLVAVGVVTLIGRAAGFSEIREELSQGQLGWLVFCAVGQVLVFTGYAGVYRGAVAFEGGPRISFPLAVKVVVTAFGASAIVAAAGAASLAVHYWALRHLGFGRRESGVRMVGFNTLAYLVFAVCGFAAAVAALVLDQAPLAMLLPWIVLMPAILLAARWFTQPSRVERWTTSTGGWFRRALALGVDAAYWVRRAIVEKEGHAMLVAAALYWGGNLLSVWGGLRAFGVEIGIAALALAFTTGYLAQALPLPLIATGGVDAATIFALTAVGVPLSSALLGVAAHRLFAFWIPLVPGLVMVALMRRTGRDLDRVGTPLRAEEAVPSVS